MTAKSTTSATFEQDVLQAEGPVLVDFWAEWCGPCRMVSPVLDQIQSEAVGARTGTEAPAFPNIAARSP